MKNIPDAQKIFELSTIWKEAAYNFAFWDKVDVDWDAAYRSALPRVLATQDLHAYYCELKRFVTLLNDGHTDVGFPPEIAQDAAYFSALPVRLAQPGREIIVTATAGAAQDAVPLHSTLVAIDGQDIYDFIRETIYPTLWHANEDACSVFVMNRLMFGRRGSSAVYTFAREGRRFDVRLERRDPDGIVWRGGADPAPAGRLISHSDAHAVSVTADGIAVIRIASFADDALPAQLYACFAELSRARGYVVDVRDNGGGNSNHADAVAGLFIDGDFRSCFAETQLYEPTFKAWAMYRDDLTHLAPDEAQRKLADDPFSLKLYRMRRNVFYTRDEGNAVVNPAPGTLRGPLAVLMNQHTFSAAEDFVDVMKAHTSAVFIGNNTAGTSGQPLCVPLESGGSFRICTRRCIAQNGEDIYNRGFAPDVRVIPTAEDVAAGRDAALETGLDAVRRSLRPPQTDA